MPTFIPVRVKAAAIAAVRSHIFLALKKREPFFLCTSSTFVGAVSIAEMTLLSDVNMWTLQLQTYQQINLEVNWISAPFKTSQLYLDPKLNQRKPPPSTIHPSPQKKEWLYPCGGDFLACYGCINKHRHKYTEDTDWDSLAKWGSCY